MRHARYVVPVGKDDDDEMRMFDPSGVEALAGGLRVNGVLTEVCSPQPKAACALCCSCSQIRTSHVQVNLDEFALPVKKLKGTDPVETLDLSNKGLRVASAVVIASLIGVNGVLTTVWTPGHELTQPMVSVCVLMHGVAAHS